MAFSPPARVRTAAGVSVVTAAVLVLVFGSPYYVHWAADHATAARSSSLFLRTIAWPRWSFAGGSSVRDVIGEDIKALLVIALTGVFVTLLAVAPGKGVRGGLSQVLHGWAGYMFAGALAGFLTAFLHSGASLFGAVASAMNGATYGLLIGWVVGLATLGSRD